MKKTVTSQKKVVTFRGPIVRLTKTDRLKLAVEADAIVKRSELAGLAHGNHGKGRRDA